MPIVLIVLISIFGICRAQEPVSVTLDEEFVVEEVIQRLEEHMTNLQTWYATAKRCGAKGTRSHLFNLSVLRQAVAVSHPRMVACFNAMEQQESLEPAFALWESFKKEHSQSASDQLLCKEIALLDMHLYNTMLGHLQRTGTRVTVAQMLELYHILAALPIYELLSLLDDIAREIITLLEQTYNGEESFFTWLWHNWWVPPTIVSNAVTSLLEGLDAIMHGEPENDELEQKYFVHGVFEQPW